MFWDELTGDFGKPSSTASVLSLIERSADLSDSLVVIFFFSGAGSFVTVAFGDLFWNLRAASTRRMPKLRAFSGVNPGPPAGKDLAKPCGHTRGPG
jgi:hypothetical protein